MKDFDFINAVVEYIKARGGREVEKAPDMGMSDHVHGPRLEIMTRYGRLSISPSIWRENRQKTHYTVFSRFEDSLELVVKKFSINPHSGKWNFHYGVVKKSDVQATFEDWKRQVERALFPRVFVMRESDGAIPLETIEIKDSNPRVVALMVRGLLDEVARFNKDNAHTEEPKYVFLGEVSEYLLAPTGVYVPPMGVEVLWRWNESAA